MKMTIRTKRKADMCDFLTNGMNYILISIFNNDHTNSDISISVIADNGYTMTYDSSYFRMNSIKIK